MSLFAELKRRNVIRMAGLYLVGAWLVTQVSATLLPVFHAPEWLMKYIVILLFVGFIPALIIAWIFELTPDGLKRDGDVPVAESICREWHMLLTKVLLQAGQDVVIFGCGSLSASVRAGQAPLGFCLPPEGGVSGNSNREAISYAAPRRCPTRERDKRR